MYGHYTNDITAIYYTANRLPEFFANNLRQNLLKAIGDIPLISISKQPLDFGNNIVVDSEYSIINAYRAPLIGAKLATTPYIALCEDDILYPDEHFHAFRPSPKEFAYNMCRWNLYTWSKPPFYSLRQQIAFCTMIAPRELFIETMEEKLSKYVEGQTDHLNWFGEPGRHDYERHLGVTERPFVEFLTYSPIVILSHKDSLGYQTQGQNKRAHRLRAIEIPYFGRAEDVLKLYNKEQA